MKKAGPAHAGPIRVAGARILLLAITAFMLAGSAILALESLGVEVIARS